MRNDFIVFIGFDSAQPEAAMACWKSIVDNDKEGEVTVQLIDKSTLIQNNLYWREENETDSDQLSFTRFLTPYLKGFYGRALYCDSSFIWKCSPKEILEYSKKDEEKAVWVAQHNLGESRKSWSSLILFNCQHQSVRSLTPDVVSEQTSGYLHEFEWIPENEIGELPKTYSFLVGHYKDYGIMPKALNFFEGTPLQEGYENCEFADEFLKYLRPNL